MAKLILSAAFFIGFVWGLVSNAFGAPSEALLDALAKVESNNKPLVIGDNGEAWGIYQLHEEYIEDVNRIEGTKFEHRDAFQPTVARYIVFKYLDFYGKLYQKKTGKEPTDEVYARIHNGGPTGWTYNVKIGGKNAPNRYANTSKYWEKVKAELNKTEEDKQ